MASHHRGVYAALQTFIRLHNDCGEIVAVSAEPPSLEGYRLSAVCRGCGAGFERYVTAAAARLDLVYSTLLVSPN
jgi:hypothetical protein